MSFSPSATISSSASASDSEVSPKRGVKRKREGPASDDDSSSEATSNSNSESEDSLTSEITHSSARKVIQKRRASGIELSSNSDSTADPDPQAEKDGSDGEDEMTLLSHAEKRRQKKKELKTAKANDSSTNKNSVEKGTKDTLVNADILPKRQNSIWVGNLAFKTTENALIEFFKRGIPGCGITRVNMPTKSGKDVGGGKGGMRGENRGFAYLDFSSQDEQQAAMKLSEQNLDGRRLLIKAGDDFQGRPATIGTEEKTIAVGRSKTAQKILAVQKQPPAPTLFFGNLGFQSTEDSIRGMLEAHRKVQTEKRKSDNANDNEQFGNNGDSQNKWIRRIRVGTFEDSGNCKGWAFVDFYNIEDATIVLIDPRNHHLDGRKLVVEYASAEAVRRGGGSGPRPDRVKNGQQKVQPKAVIHQKETVQENAEEPPAKKPRIAGRKQGEKTHKHERPKPGAALALAKREKVAIVPSTGKKIKF